MPVISHAHGIGNKNEIINLINTQLRVYVYAALFVVFMFAINYFNLISFWIGEGKFIGNTILSLLLLFNFFNLIGYFMSNVGYALGDIKRNSQFLIVRNVVFGGLIFFAAKFYGILGTIVVSLSMTFFADLFFFSYRVFKLGYLKIVLVKQIASVLALIIPLCFLIAFFSHFYLETLLPEKMFFFKMLTSSAFFTLFYIPLILLGDSNLRNRFNQIKKKIFLKMA
jgi:hypothetical protein